MDFLDFGKEKVQSINLETLERTFKENDIYGKPLRGIYHFELIRRFVEEARNIGYDVAVYDMFAANNKDRVSAGVSILPQIEEKYGEKAVEAHVLRRVFTNIRLKDFDNEDMTTNLAISYHQGGVQVGFGNMVKICHNQQMLNADMYASTYAEKGKRGERMELESVIETAFGWLRDAKNIVMAERETIEKMKNVRISMEETLKFIGLLTATRVAVDSKNKNIHQNIVFPLNNTQINDFTESVLIKNYENHGSLSVFDLYDSATDLYKATRMEIPNMLPQNRAMAKMLTEHFAI